jgi:hypothetical protein
LNLSGLYSPGIQKKKPPDLFLMVFPGFEEIDFI